MPPSALATRARAQVEHRDAHQAFIEELLTGAEGRELTEDEDRLITERQAQIEALNGEIAMLTRDIDLDAQARRRLADLDLAGATTVERMEYHSAGAYLHDYLAAHRGDTAARQRLDRAAEHMVTDAGDTTGIVPDPILGSVLNFIDAQRPLVTALGTLPVTAGPTFHRPRLVDANVATGVAAQAADKDELASKAFTIVRDDVSLETYGGYVNVSRQLEDFSSPAALDVIVNQLATRYARTTETVVATALETTTQTGTLDTSTGPGAATLAALAQAAVDYYTSAGAMPTWVAMSVDVWAILSALTDAADRPLFPMSGLVNVPGGTGGVTDTAGSTAGLRWVVSYALTAGTMVVGGPATAELYERRIGTLQVVEPSVLGRQVAYAGYLGTYLPLGNGDVINAVKIAVT